MHKLLGWKLSSCDGARYMRQLRCRQIWNSNRFECRLRVFVRGGQILAVGSKRMYKLLSWELPGINGAGVMYQLRGWLLCCGSRLHCMRIILCLG